MDELVREKSVISLEDAPQPDLLRSASSLLALGKVEQLPWEKDDVKQPDQKGCVAHEPEPPHEATDAEAERRPDAHKVRARWKMPLFVQKVATLEPANVGEEALDNELPACPMTSAGSLPNGLKYFVRTCRKPKGRAALRLAVKVGSLEEEDDQLGLAHFLEHACFLGTTSFGKGDLIKYMESIGASFGADLNAHTSFSETVYKLSIPIEGEAGRQNLARGVQILSEWAFGVTLREDDVNMERNVVLEEWRSGKGSSQRLRDEYFHRVLGHTRLGQRFPIGGDQSDAAMRCVREAPACRMRDFYEAWYRPELCAVVAVGDFENHAEAVDLITRFFTAWGRTPDERFCERAPSYPLDSAHKHNGGPATVLLQTDPELTNASISVGALRPRPARETGNTARCLRSRQVASMFFDVLNKRLARIARSSDDAPFTAAGAGASTLEKDTQMVEVNSGLRNEGRWRGALETMLTEFFRLCLHGALASELAMVQKNYVSNLETAYIERHDVTSGRLVDKLTDYFLGGERTSALSSEEYTIRVSLALATSVTLADLAEYGQQMLPCLLDADWITATFPAVPPDCTEESLLQVVTSVATAAQRGEVAPPADFEAPSLLTLYAALSEDDANCAPSEVVSEHRIPLGKHEAVHWTFGNGCTVTWIRVSYDADTITLSAFAPGGTTELDTQEFLDLTPLLGVDCGVCGRDPVYVRDALAGVAACGEAQLGQYSRDLDGWCSAKFFEDMLRLTWIDLKRKRFAQTEYARVVKNVMQAIELQDKDPNYQLGRRIHELCVGTDPRHAAIPFDATERRRALTNFMSSSTVQRVAALHTRAVSGSAPDEWSVVLAGPLPGEEELRRLLCKYVGLLGARSRPTVEMGGVERGPDEEDASQRRSGPWVGGACIQSIPREFAGADREVRSELRMGVADKCQARLFFAAWPPRSEASFNDARSVAADVLQMVLLRKLRQDMGAIYSCSASYSRGDVALVPLDAAGHQTTAVSFSCNAADVDRCVEATRDVLRGLQNVGVSDDDLAAVLKQRCTSMSESLQFNDTYAGWVRTALVRTRFGGDAPQRLVVRRAAEAPVELLRDNLADCARTGEERYRSCTKEAIDQALREMCPHNTGVVVTHLPELIPDTEAATAATVGDRPPKEAQSPPGVDLPMEDQRRLVLEALRSCDTKGSGRLPKTAFLHVWDSGGVAHEIVESAVHEFADDDGLLDYERLVEWLFQS